MPPKAFADTTLDFHQVVSLLMEYPIAATAPGLDPGFPGTGGGPRRPATPRSRSCRPAPGHLTPTTAATYRPELLLAQGERRRGQQPARACRRRTFRSSPSTSTARRSSCASSPTTCSTRRPVRCSSCRRCARPGWPWPAPGRRSLYNGKFGKAKTDNVTIVGGGSVTLDAASLLHGLRWQAYDVAERALVLAV